MEAGRGWRGTSTTCEDVGVVLLQLLGRLVVLARAFVLPALPQELATDLLDMGPVLSIQEDDNGVALGVVQLLHCVGGDVQQAVLTLGPGGKNNALSLALALSLQPKALPHVQLQKHLWQVCCNNLRTAPLPQRCYSIWCVDRTGRIPWPVGLWGFRQPLTLSMTSLMACSLIEPWGHMATGSPGLLSK